VRGTEDFGFTITLFSDGSSLLTITKKEHMSQRKVTIQDVFNAGWNAFVIGDKLPGFDTGLDHHGNKVRRGGIRYRAFDGRCCVFGLVIPRDNPISGAGAMSISTVREVHKEHFKAVFDDELVLLDARRLQKFQSELHDDHVSLADGTWKVSKADLRKAYLDIAKDFKLEVPGAA
jgi:hypothetical protein